MDHFEPLSKPLPSAVLAEVISPPGQPSIFSLTLDLDRWPLAHAELPALGQQLRASLWNSVPEAPRVYLSCYDSQKQLITCAEGESPMSNPLIFRLPFSNPESKRKRNNPFSNGRARRSLRVMRDSPWLAGMILSHMERALTLEAAVDGWTRALALRDDETSQHTQRVTSLATRLGRKIGLSEEMILVIQRGAKLHDIGKMGIPDRILLKPGPLDENDWSIMVKHPLMAYEMLQAIPHIDGMLDIPYCHHEHWDGSGYPRGLRGDTIPLTARIFSVVDVWDALCSDRPYRKAWRRPDAVQYIRDQSGRLFDPVVVCAFMELILGQDGQSCPCMDLA